MYEPYSKYKMKLCFLFLYRTRSLHVENMGLKAGMFIVLLLSRTPKGFPKIEPNFKHNSVQ
jgi:hypothetical protein